MTLDEFLAELKSTVEELDLELLPLTDGVIRAAIATYPACPITIVARHRGIKGGNLCYLALGQELGLSALLSQRIARTADNLSNYEYFDPELYSTLTKILSRN